MKYSVCEYGIHELNRKASAICDAIEEICLFVQNTYESVNEIAEMLRDVADTYEYAIINDRIKT